jgi:predicted nucleotidyltransferase/uncharacterized protein (UPF0332 family)
MAKDEPDYKKAEVVKEEVPKDVDIHIPPELRETLQATRQKLEQFKNAILQKFDKYIVSVALLPQPKQFPPDIPPEEVAKLKGKINVLVLIDDSEPTKMAKFELRDKLTTIMDSIAKEIDEKFLPQTLLLSELWQNCYDAKYDILHLMSMAAPIYDTGMFAAIKIAELHKSMVLQKFDKYIVAYVLAGSLVQGKATKESDIDVFIVIDDTDVKKMTRGELKERLRGMIISMGIRAGEETGIRNKLNIQIYILTDFWENIKEAHPVIFTFLRDGVPFYDRGIFMPWKQLLKMGRIKPSAEAIDMYMSSGEQMIERVKFKIKDIAMEDLFYAILTPSQAALMMYGVPPPTPKETPEVLREIFVKKEKLMTDEEVDILEKNIRIRKDIEHGTQKDLSGKELDELLQNSEKYLKRIRKLFSQIEKIKDEETMANVYDTLTTVLRDVLRMEGIEKVQDVELVSTFEDKLIATGKVPAKYLRSVHDMIDAKKDYDAGKISKLDLQKARKAANELIRFLVEHMQRKRARELERAKIRVRIDSKVAEVTLLGDTAYIVKDLESQDLQYLKAKIKQDGSLEMPEKATLEELEKDLAKLAVPPKVFVRQSLFESLKKIFGRDVEIML